MERNQIKINERTFSGHIIAWIQIAIKAGKTVFQDATNDPGIKFESGRTKFPDILLFSDKISGIVFNGWELKFPDTPIDDQTLLGNALEKAKRLKSDSFVTWNGSEAAIWKISNDDYSIENLSVLKRYPPIRTISSREDLSHTELYRKNEPVLQQRLNEILSDLDSLLKSGDLKQALNISDHFISAIQNSSSLLIPQFESLIKKLLGEDHSFRSEFNKWKILESTTIRMMKSSSRRLELVSEERILAKFIFHNLISKLVFYNTLSFNLSGKLSRIDIEKSVNVKRSLQNYFDEAAKIDFAAVFRMYFTDQVEFNKTVSDVVRDLLKVFETFDFRVLPVEVIGSILETLIPQEEKRKFGQYFTNPILADLVTFPAIKNNKDILFDPTCGTGSILESMYRILKHYGISEHTRLLQQVWGNDISHFPAIMSVINLYKQEINQNENFPRVLRSDFFELKPKETVSFPDPMDIDKLKKEELPQFDAIVSNFPFIQQEDIQSDRLTSHFRDIFALSQEAFNKEGDFHINERSDYFSYCIYNSFRFIKEDGRISAITSNAWLGKEYGLQLKKFILDNFKIKFVVRSIAEHWFQDSQVSTIFILLEAGRDESATKFVTINKKLDELFNTNDDEIRVKQISDFYSDLEYSDFHNSNIWKQDAGNYTFYSKNDNSISFQIIPKKRLIESIIHRENWEMFFSSTNLFATFEDKFISSNSKIFQVFRGERTGWNKMFILENTQATETGIEAKYLMPYIKGPSELDGILADAKITHYLFSCSDSEVVLQAEGERAFAWINRFAGQMNKNGTKTIKDANSSHKPHWYSIIPKTAQIVSAVNPYERLFFSLTRSSVAIDQRLIGIKVKIGHDPVLISAILNSIITLMQLEQSGTSRHQGALDLNANYFKNIKVLNPYLISKSQKSLILKHYAKICNRKILTVEKEFFEKDRLDFEKAIFDSFDISFDIYYQLRDDLVLLVNQRVNQKKK